MNDSFEMYEFSQLDIEWKEEERIVAWNNWVAEQFFYILLDRKGSSETFGWVMSQREGMMYWTVPGFPPPNSGLQLLSSILDDGLNSWKFSWSVL